MEHRIFQHRGKWSNLYGICHECPAQLVQGPLNFARFEDFPRRSHDVFLNDPKHQTPFTFLIGWHLTLLLREPAHAGPLGVLGVINGQVIKDLVLAGVFGEALSLTKWDERFNYLVGMAWAAFDTWAKAHNKKHNVKLWTRWRLALTTMKSFPKLKCKAHDALVVLEWVAHMSNKHVVDCGDLPQEYGELRAWLCWSWHRFLGFAVPVEPSFLMRKHPNSDL